MSPQNQEMMTDKKTPRANLEKKRFGLIQAGLVSALAITLVAFEWTTFDAVDGNSYAGITLETQVEEDLPPVVLVEKPTPKLVTAPKVNLNVTPVINDVIEVNENPDPDTSDENEPDLTALGDIFGSDTLEMLDTTDFIALSGVVEIPPHFEDCSIAWERAEISNCAEKEMMTQLYSEVKVPAIVRDMGAGKHTAYVQFIVGKNGKVRDVECLNKDRVNNAVAREAVRAVKAVKGWIPGRQAGRNVDVQFVIPITISVR